MMSSQWVVEIVLPLKGRIQVTWGRADTVRDAIVPIVGTVTYQGKHRLSASHPTVTLSVTASIFSLIGQRNQLDASKEIPGSEVVGLR